MSGYYSIRYMLDDPVDRGLEFAMDYNWRKNSSVSANQWKCSDTEVGTMHWMVRKSIPDHGFRALLDHFGLEEADVDMSVLVTMSPAHLAAIRRQKEMRLQLECKVLRNMRAGCPPNEQYADMFESA